MTRTYETREQYDDACARLAAHLNALTSDQISHAYADGGTTDAGGHTWVPAGEHLMTGGAWTRWFMEEHGAAARFDGHQWHAAEPGEDELTDAALAAWGEDSDDFGYPPANARER